MALNKEILRAELVKAFNKPETFNNINTVADAIATAIHSYIIAADVVGVCPSGGGPLNSGKVI